MSGLTPKRLFLTVAAAVLFATSAFAVHPSQRTLARMAFDERTRMGVLFGGRGAFDGATGVAHASDETWHWNGGRWLQQFPLTKPPARSSHNMTYDSKNQRVVMFGGRVEAPDRDSDPSFLNDLWAFQNGDWVALDEGSAQKPATRHYSGLTYDRARDRIILYGGSRLKEDGITLESLFDTWIFDGTNWTQVEDDTPKVVKPLLAYDIAANQTYMVGLNEDGTQKLMYRFDFDGGAWESITPTAMPACINEGHLIYRAHTQKLVFMGGVCTTNTPNAEEVFEYDRTANTWTKLKVNAYNRGLAQAVTYDPLGGDIIVFGGSVTFLGGLTAITALFDANNQFSNPTRILRPSPRSLTRLETDTARGKIWMFGGLDETSEFYNGDFWSYQDGGFTFNPETTNGPSGCESPLTAYDSDRARLVVVCGGTNVFEWDGAAWKSFTSITKKPSTRFYANLAYDANLKKTVLFGGYLSSNYRNDTWTWNGTEWAELDIDNDDRPPHRGVFAMWYDPLKKQTILYGGVGRSSINEKITRYSDMWSFNGSSWAKIETPTPGQRFGPQIAVHPTTGKLLLFGGLVSEQIDEDSLRQFFANDTWEWDGGAGKWTQLAPARRPDVRENGSMAWDPTTNEFVLFAGYANGFYRSDVWSWNGTDWTPRPDIAGKRRAIR